MPVLGYSLWRLVAVDIGPMSFSMSASRRQWANIFRDFGEQG